MKARVHGPRRVGTISVPIPAPVEVEGLGAVFAPKGKKGCDKASGLKPALTQAVAGKKSKGGK